MTGSVLVVEDDAGVTSAYRALFEAHGHQVGIAGTLAEAVAACLDRTPDLMLLDLALPDGDGLAVLDTLRKQGRRVPVTVALTGRDDPVTRKRCLDAGCIDVLLKPVPARELAAKVTGWIEKFATPD